MPRVTDLRRDEVLDATLRLLRERDFASLSMSDVARAARTSKETLYRHFGNKEGLFSAIVARRSASIREDLEQALGDTRRSPADVLEQAALRYLETVLSEDGAAVNRLAIASSRTAPALARALVKNGREHVFIVFCRYLSRLQAGGLLAPGHDPSRMAEAFFALAAGDSQVRLLLGVLPTPPAKEMKARAARATTEFLALYGPRD